MISIVLPTYNGEQYISKSIESILNQSYDDFELIIVNDCSTDSTYDIIRKYMKKDKRIRLFNNKINRGLPNSLNIGFKHAKGEFLTWTSDDNFYEYNALEEMVKVIMNKHVDFVYAACNIVNGNGNIIGKSATGHISGLTKANCIWACFLYKRRVYDMVGGYNPKFRLMEDYDYWLRIYEQGFCFAFIPKVLYNYRRHNKSLTATRQNDIYKMENKVRANHFFKILCRKNGNFKEKMRDLCKMFEGLKGLNKKLKFYRFYIYFILGNISKIIFKFIYKEDI